jgi:hypothetical protein
LETGSAQLPLTRFRQFVLFPLSQSVVEKEQVADVWELPEAWPAASGVRAAFER